MLSLLFSTFCLAADASSSSAPKAPASPLEASLEEATRCGRDVPLHTESCSYSTGNLARRAVEEGLPWQQTTALEAVSSPPNPMVFTPVLANPQDPSYLIGTAFLERVTAAFPLDNPLLLSGRSLEVDGVRFVVLMGAEPLPAGAADTSPLQARPLR